MSLVYLCPPPISLEILFKLSNNIKAPESLTVDATAPASHVDAPSSAPFQIYVEANETFAPARSVDAHASGDSPVDAHSAPLYLSVDAFVLDLICNWAIERFYREVMIIKLT